MRNKTLFSLDTGWESPKPEEVQFIKNFCKLKNIQLEMGTGRFSYPRMFDIFVVPNKKFSELRDTLKNIRSEIIVVSVDANFSATQIDLYFNKEFSIGKIETGKQDEVENENNYFTLNGIWYAIKGQ